MGERTIGNAWVQRHGDAIRPVWSRLSLRLLKDNSFASVIQLAAVNDSLVEGRPGGFGSLFLVTNTCMLIFKSEGNRTKTKSKRKRMRLAVDAAVNVMVEA